MTTVRVVIEYEINELDVLTIEDSLVIRDAVLRDAPTIFEYTDGYALWADGFTVEVLE